MAGFIRRALTALLFVIACSRSVPYAQENPNPSEPAVILPRAWAILTAAVDAGTLQEQVAAVSALAAAGTPRALEMFERAAREGSAPVRSSAIWYLPAENSSKYLPLKNVIVDARHFSPRSISMNLSRPSPNHADALSKVNPSMLPVAVALAEVQLPCD
jgi:hypothetical protein